MRVLPLMCLASVLAPAFVISNMMICVLGNVDLRIRVAVAFNIFCLQLITIVFVAAGITGSLPFSDSPIDVATIPIQVVTTWYLLYSVFAIVPLWNFLHYCWGWLGFDFE